MELFRCLHWVLGELLTKTCGPILLQLGRVKILVIFNNLGGTLKLGDCCRQEQDVCQFSGLLVERPGADFGFGKWRLRGPLKPYILSRATSLSAPNFGGVRTWVEDFRTSNVRKWLKPPTCAGTRRISISVAWGHMEGFYNSTLSRYTIKSCPWVGRDIIQGFSGPHNLRVSPLIMHFFGSGHSTIYYMFVTC